MIFGIIGYSSIGEVVVMSGYLVKIFLFIGFFVGLWIFEDNFFSVLRIFFGFAF